MKKRGQKITGKEILDFAPKKALVCKAFLPRHCHGSFFVISYVKPLAIAYA